MTPSESKSLFHTLSGTVGLWVGRFLFYTVKFLYTCVVFNLDLLGKGPCRILEVYGLQQLEMVWFSIR